MAITRRTGVPVAPTAAGRGNPANKLAMLRKLAPLLAAARKRGGGRRGRRTAR